MREVIRYEQAGQSVLLFGGKRMGKTLFLDRLGGFLGTVIRAPGELRDVWPTLLTDADMEQDLPPFRLEFTHLPVLVSLQGHGLNRLNDLYGWLARKIRREGLEKFFDSDLLDREEIRAPEGEIDAEGLESFLSRTDDLLATKGLGGLALLIDEVEAIIRQPWCGHFLSFLRMLDDRTLGRRIFFCLTGGARLYDFRHDDGSHYFNITYRKILDSLDLKARRRLAAEPFGSDPLPEPVLQEVEALTGGHPWILTHILQSLYEESGEFDGPASPILRNRFGSEEVKKAIRFYHEHTSDFSTWQRDLSWEEEASKSGGADPIQPGSEQPVVWKLLEDLWKQGRMEFNEIENNEDHWKRAALILRFHGFIEQDHDGTLFPACRIFRDFAKNNKLIKGSFIKETPSSLRLAHLRDTPGDDSSHIPSGWYRYDVALSYASEQRELAESLANNLETTGRLKVFYDRHRKHEIWGSDLNDYLPEVYSRSARLCVLMVSTDYIRKVWPKKEARAAIEGLRSGRVTTLLPVRVDQSPVPEELKDVSYIDLPMGSGGIADIASEVMKRVGVEKNES